MAARSFLRFTTKSAIGGGIVYYYYTTGLWKDSDTTIQNYEKLRKDFLGFYESKPQLVKVVETGQSHLSSTVAPAVDAVSDFKKEWFNFDFYWLGTGDGVIKPVWNKTVGVVTDFIAHAPEDVPEGLKILSVNGWNKLNETIAETNKATAAPKSE
jgi:hypothetical protein